jgi:hypothetical protein
MPNGSRQEQLPARLPWGQRDDGPRRTGVMDPNHILVGVGALSIAMTGVGAFRVLNSAAKKIDPSLPLFERGTAAIEKIAAVAQASLETQQILADLREGQEQIRISIACIASDLESVKAKQTPCAAADGAMCRYGVQSHG